MTTGQWAFTFVALTLACAGVATWLAYHVGFNDGHESGRLYERNRHSTRALQAARQPRPDTYVWMAYQPGKHAPWQPRVRAARAAYSVDGGPAGITAPVIHRRTDTGELRGLVAGSDLYIDRMRAEGAAYRGELVR